MLHLLRVVAAIGAITRLFSVAFLLPVIISIFYDPYELRLWGWAVPRGAVVFFVCFGLSFWLGTWLRFLGRHVSEEDLQEREAYMTVGLGWLLLVVLAMFPFLMAGTLRSPVDAFFEAMSGLTTTGATVIDDHLEDVLPSLMMWRAFLQFLGGMGIIVLSIAILARLTHGGVQLLQAEVPGPTFGRLAPRLGQMARLMWRMYLALAAVCFTLFAIIMSTRHGMDGKQTVYEALLHTFTTIATGGFSNHTASIAFFDDPLLEAVMVAFMLISGTNYALLLMVATGHWKNLWRDHEWRFYVGNFLLITTIISISLWRVGVQFGGAVRQAGFTVASLMTSTGYVTVDYDAWPEEARFFALFIMVAGGSAGSTSGGMKLARVLLMFKVIARQIRMIKHPHAVVQIHMAGRLVKPATIMATVGFVVVFCALWALCTGLLMLVDPEFTNVIDAASASVAALSNIGPALGVVGPTQHYGHLTDASKIILSVAMWFGRLEIFTALLLLTPNTWRH